jgi:hypothetical protein
MSTMREEGDVSAEREIIVSAHVVDRYRQRSLDSEDQRPFVQVADEIAWRIKLGVVMNHKPKDFGLYRERRRQFPENERFVLCDENVGFVVKEIENGDWVVKTMLTRTGGTPRQ